MTAKLIRSDECQPAAWKNGLGTTTEIAVSPPGSDFGTFAWRVSIADMVTDSLFSTLPGIDRTLVALGGDGIRLQIADATVVLAEYSQVSFAGETPVSGGPIHSPTRDLNLMVRRGSTRGSVSIEHAVTGRTVPATQSTVTVALVIAGTARVDTRETTGEFESAFLTAGDSAVVSTQEATITAPGVLALITIVTLRPEDT